MYRGSNRGRGRGRGRGAAQNPHNMVKIKTYHPQPHAKRYGKEFGPVRVTKIAVLGHSFVAGMEANLIRQRTENPYHPTLQDQLNLEIAMIEPLLLGIRSGYIDDLRDKEDMIDDADAIVIDIGSNDICTPINVTSMVNTLRGVVEHWLDTYGNIKVAVICKQLYRNALDPKYSNKTLDQYNRDVDKFNGRLEDWVAQTSFRVETWKHKNFVNPMGPCIGSDGVHPNTDLGTWRYQKSIRGAILFADRFTPF